MVAREDAPKQTLLLDDERVDRLVEQRASPGQASEPEPQPNEHPGVREEGRDDTIPDVARVDDAGVERGQISGWSLICFVEADLEVGEMDELCPLDRVGLEASAVVVENAWRR